MIHLRPSRGQEVTLVEPLANESSRMHNQHLFLRSWAFLTAILSGLRSTLIACFAFTLYGMSLPHELINETGSQHF